MQERRDDIDWLRVIAMLVVFVYHCTRFFDTVGWHVKNAEQSTVVLVLTSGLVWTWVMPLFFLLAGMGAWYALHARTGGQYLGERVKRLLLPLYTVGLLLIIPPQFFFDSVTNKGYAGTFWEGVWLFFQNVPAEFAAVFPAALDDPGHLVPYGFPGHVWFLQYLFLISLLTLPLLLSLKSAPGQRWIERLAGWCDRRGGIFLFVIPLSFILISLRFLFSGGRTWADFVWYAAFFVIGYILVADKRFTTRMQRAGWFCLPVWLVGFFGVVTVFALVLDYDPTPGGNEPFSLLYIGYQIVWSVVCWSAVVFVLSMGAKYLNVNNTVLSYANEAVLPFYLLHQTVILGVGWFVVPWDMGSLPKFLIITVVSFALIMALYELLIRRFNGMRFVFGMRPKQHAKTRPTPHAKEAGA